MANDNPLHLYEIAGAEGDYNHGEMGLKPLMDVDEVELRSIEHLGDVDDPNLKSIDGYEELLDAIMRRKGITDAK